MAREIARVGPTNLSCLVFGETGTGKELVARALHRFSGRPGALQAINCAAVPASLFESELFGYKRGAFSGADRDKPGLVHGAHGGTLFLDEIGDMPLEVQAKLLRLLESGEVLPLGATRAERVDVRTVCATHHDLTARVRDGQFRGDLFARLAEHTIELPPLRERKEDLYPLTAAFLRKQGLAPHVPFDVMTALVAHDWPFNVRELESSVRRAVVLSRGAGLTRENLPAAVLAASQAASIERRDNVPSAAPPPLAEQQQQQQQGDDDPFYRGAPKEALLRKLLAEHAGNLASVARALGKHRTQVQRYIERYGIDVTTYR